jgi:hypothetical protein
MKRIVHLLLLFSVFGIAQSREFIRDSYDSLTKELGTYEKERPEHPSRRTQSPVGRIQKRDVDSSLSNSFEKKLYRAGYEIQNMQQRLKAYKQLIVYAQKHEIDELSLDCFLSAIESTFRGRDLAAKSTLLGLQEVLCDALQAPIFEGHYRRLRQLLDKLSYDLRPFAIRAGDYVVLEVPVRNLFCAVEQRADGVHIVASEPVPGNQVQVDCLFKITTSMPGAIIKFGDTVELEPLYVRHGGYVLPPPTKFGITYDGTGHRGSDTTPLLFHEGGKNAITFVSLQKKPLTGAPVVVGQGLRLIDAESLTQWALQGNQLVGQVGDGMRGLSRAFFSLRNIKPEIVDRVHKKIIQKNLDSVVKEPTFEARVLALKQVICSMRTGFDFEQREQLRKLLEALYDAHAKASTNGLRLLEELFMIAASHPQLVDSKLMFQQFSSNVVEALNSRSIMYGDIVSLVKSDRQGAVQVSIDEALIAQGHLAVTMGNTSGVKLQGQQCLMFASPGGKQGSVSYGDEVTVTSFFVEDGRDGGLLACPVIWWVNSIGSGKKAAHQVMASAIKAVQTHNGQEIFVIQPPEKGLRGPLVSGDIVKLYGKQAASVLAFGCERVGTLSDAVFEVRRVDRRQLNDLADNRFKQYVQRVQGENSLSKKIKMLEAALDLFKGQRLLSAKASKILYAEIKHLSSGAKALPESAIPALKKLLAKAQDAPFSSPAKKRFIDWSNKLRT